MLFLVYSCNVHMFMVRNQVVQSQPQMFAITNIMLVFVNSNLLVSSDSEKIVADTTRNSHLFLLFQTHDHFMLTFKTFSSGRCFINRSLLQQTNRLVIVAARVRDDHVMIFLYFSKFLIKNVNFWLGVVFSLHEKKSIWALLI